MKLNIVTIDKLVQNSSFFLDPSLLALAAEAEKQGFVRRPSHTQIEWKDAAAIDRARAAITAEDKQEYEDVFSKYCEAYHYDCETFNAATERTNWLATCAAAKDLYKLGYRPDDLLDMGEKAKAAAIERIKKDGKQ